MLRTAVCILTVLASVLSGCSGPAMMPSKPEVCSMLSDVEYETLYHGVEEMLSTRAFTDIVIEIASSEISPAAKECSLTVLNYFR